MINKLISIIVPVFNQAKHLERCIDSILTQTYSYFELIIIDDGSTDDSLYVAKSYSKKDSRVRCFSTCNQGVSHARNIGLDNSKGDYIVFVDSDDYVQKEYLSLLLLGITEANSDICYCNHLTLKEDDYQNDVQVNDFLVSSSIKKFNLMEYDYSNDYMLRHVWSAIFKKSIINELRFDERIHVGEDALFVSSYLIKTKANISVVESPLYFYIKYRESGNWGVFTEKKSTVIQAWSLIANNYTFYRKQRLDCYICLAKEGVFGIRRLLFDENGNLKDYDRTLYKRVMKQIRHHYFHVISSGWSLKRKIAFTIFCISPKQYCRRFKK